MPPLILVWDSLLDSLHEQSCGTFWPPGVSKGGFTQSKPIEKKKSRKAFRASLLSNSTVAKRAILCAT
eukprot:scaffold721_cov131-Cylindrotheca_fusiformis.AAC.6